jgi:Fic family protein
MALIRKVKIGQTFYYYLEQSIRTGNTVLKKRLYLGKSIPKDITEITEKFVRGIYAEEWYPLFQKIKKAYSSELRRMPALAKEKAIEAFMVSFTYDTQRIEGSSLSFKDTAQVLLEQTTPQNVPTRDIKEAEAHRTVFYEMLGFDGDISLAVVLKWHSGLFSGTKEAGAGKIRDYDVKITNSRFIPPRHAYMESMLGNFFAWYNAAKKGANPVELAALCHLKFVTIHPFGDGNGRISRLLMNFILKKNGYPMLNIHYVNRRGYYTALERSQVKNDDGIFLRWFFRKYVAENKAYLGS